MVLVYIHEAHAKDEWGLGDSVNGKYNVNAPKFIQERVDLARQYVADHGLATTQPVVVDLMRNEAMHGYHALPERLYVVEQDHVVFQGGPGPHAYSVPKLRAWLENRFSS